MSSLDLSTTQLFLQSKKVAGDHSSKSSMGRDSIISKWVLIWITPQIKREMKRRAAVESIIDHLKAKHHMGRNHLAHSGGDAINAVLAVGSNFRLLVYTENLNADILVMKSTEQGV
jgi:hypothetical protein